MGSGNAVALRFEQPGEVARFAIAASHQVAGDFRAPLLGAPPQKPVDGAFAVLVDERLGVLDF